MGWFAGGGTSSSSTTRVTCRARWAASPPTLIFASALPWTLNYIPISALAAVLVYTGYKLAYPKIVPTLQKFGTSEVAIYFITIATIVAPSALKSEEGDNETKPEGEASAEGE